MAVNWQWKHKMGEVKVVRTWPNGEVEKFKLNLYGANCVAAIIHEFKQVDEQGNKHAMYNFFGFWNDLDHLKRCLGLKKNYDGQKSNLYDGKGSIDNWVHLKLNTYYPEMIKVGALFAQAGHHVELYYKESKKQNSFEDRLRSSNFLTCFRLRQEVVRQQFSILLFNLFTSFQLGNTVGIKKRILYEK